MEDWTMSRDKIIKNSIVEIARFGGRMKNM